MSSGRPLHVLISNNEGVLDLIRHLKRAPELAEEIDEIDCSHSWINDNDGVQLDALRELCGLCNRLRRLSCGTLRAPVSAGSSRDGAVLPLPAVQSFAYAPLFPLPLPLTMRLFSAAPHLQRLTLSLRYGGQEHDVKCANADGSLPSLDHLRLRTYKLETTFMGCELPLAQSSDTLEELSVHFGPSIFLPPNEEDSYTTYWQHTMARLVDALRDYVFVRLWTVRLATSPHVRGFRTTLFSQILAECVFIRRLALSVCIDDHPLGPLCDILDAVPTPLQQFTIGFALHPPGAEDLQAITHAVRSCRALSRLRVLEVEGGWPDTLDPELFPTRFEAFEALKRTCTRRKISFTLL
ncbi:hypothetical protein EXIGLDRAFT_732191 [Exidia glandulosa HHB12029]|uniref:F-box domain-containing protein n=1 Tax=Exidia glandulosa HHB12029 TaxID=1314781 RepID=A0A165KU11_EXIGL|nr:hypothetical protein EXIGLDRAFT_732191 [Exidia glandulosa HHB12029]